MTSENGLTAADIAAVTGNNGGFGGWGDGSFWIIVLFLFALMGNGWGGGYGGGGAVPTINGDLQRGFDQSAVMNGITGLGTAVSNGFANAEISRCNGQMNVLQTLANNQASTMQGFNTMSSAFQTCCCNQQLATSDVKYLVSNEASATRANTDAKVQLVLDKLCQLEMDGIKQNYENRIAGMQNQIDALRSSLNDANGLASQNAQTAAIIANNEAQTVQLERYLAPQPVPAYLVNPVGYQGNYGYGCGCSCGA
jgi:hypothetical protein